MTVLFWETGALVIALSVDSFAAGLAYGAGGIRMPAVSLLTASAVSSLVLAFSFLLGGMAGGSLPEGAVKAFGFLTLSAIGVWKLFDGSGGESAQSADRNRDRLVSPAEALTLGAALSADSLAAGIGAGALAMPLIPAVTASFAAGSAALFLGCRLGHRMAGMSKSQSLGGRAAGRVSGLLLLILAISKLM